MKFTNRVWNSPVIRFANLKGGHHINLIELKKPYAKGIKFAIHATDERYTCSMHTSYELARERFDLMVVTAKHNDQLIELGEINHSKPYPNVRIISKPTTTQVTVCTS